MAGLKIKASDLNASNYYIGAVDFSTPANTYDGDIEIAEDLGIVKFHGGIYCTQSLVALENSGIYVEGAISAGWGISSEMSLEVGDGITVGCGLIAKGRLWLSFNTPPGGIPASVTVLGAYTVLALPEEGEDESDKKIKSKDLVTRTTDFGDFFETGVSNEEKITLVGKQVKIMLGGVKYVTEPID